MPWLLKTKMIQPFRRQGSNYLRRLYSSGHGHSEPGLHFENHRVEDVNNILNSFLIMI